MFVLEVLVSVRDDYDVIFISPMTKIPFVMWYLLKSHVLVSSVRYESVKIARLLSANTKLFYGL